MCSEKYCDFVLSKLIYYKVIEGHLIKKIKLKYLHKDLYKYNQLSIIISDCN